MNGALHAALALVLAGAVLLSGLPAAGTAPAAAPSDGSGAGGPARVAQSETPSNATLAAPVYAEPNTTNYLAPPPGEVAVSAVVTPRLDVGSAVATDGVRLAIRFRVGNVLAAYQSARNDSARRAVIRTYFRRIENATAMLEERERAALSAHDAGDLSSTGYLRELARIDAAADRLLTTLGQLERFSHQIQPSYPVSRAQLGEVRVRLQSLQGPVRTRARAVLNGSHSPSRFHVETGDGAVVLAMVVRDGGRPTYLREAYLPGEREPGAIDGYSNNAGDVMDRITTIYPWLKENSGGRSVNFGPPPAYSLLPTSVYSVSSSHLHGRLTVLFDGGADQVFYEVQRKDLDLVPLGQPAVNASGGLRITVHRTRPSGPVRVAVERNGSDGFEPVDAALRVGETPIGSTGDDGVRWTVASRGAVTVTASHEGRNVTVTRFSVSPVGDNATSATAPPTANATAAATPLRPVPS